MFTEVMTIEEWKTLSSHWSQKRNSGHATLRGIDTALDEYHAEPKHDLEARIKRLNRVLVVAEDYVENKATAGKLKFLRTRRAKKVAAAEVLYGQADAKRTYLAEVLGIENRQADLLILPLDQLSPLQRFKRVGLAVKRFGDPSLARTLRSDYWGEIVDPLSRPLNKPENKVLYDRWLDERYGVITTTEHSFYRWLESQDISNMVFSQYQDEESRAALRVHAQADGGLTKDLDGAEAADTGGNSTNFSGNGWAIFALSTSGRLYAGTHDNSSHGFFHSCFLSGAPVSAAGEVKIINGQFLAVSPKSGHYKPGAREMVNLLTWMQAHNVPMAGSKVKWFAKDANGNLIMKAGGTMMVCEWFDANQFLAANGDVGALNPLRVELLNKNVMSMKIVWDPTLGPRDDNDAYVGPGQINGYVEW